MARSAAPKLGHLAFSILAAAGTIVVPTAIALAQPMWQPDGAPYCTSPSCGATDVRIVSDGVGGALSAWRASGISARHLFNDGTLDPSTPPQGSLVALIPDLGGPMVADGLGGAFVVVTDFQANYVQHVRHDGTIDPSWPANGFKLGPSTLADCQLITDGAGGTFVTWSRASDILAQHLAIDGSRIAGWPDTGLVVRHVPGISANSPRVAADRQGGCFVVWRDSRTAGGLYGQRLTGDGQVVAGWPVNGKKLLSTPTANSGMRGLVPDATGGIYIGFDDPLTQALNDDVWVMRILSDGSAPPGWPASGIQVAGFPLLQSLSSMCADSTGGVLLAWRDDHTGPTIRVQRIKPDGTLPPGWQVGGNQASTAAMQQYATQVVPDGQGGAYVSIGGTSPDRVFVQHLTSSGAVAAGWPATGFPVTASAFPSQTQHALAIDGVGGAIVAWISNTDLHAQRYNGQAPTGTLTALVKLDALSDRVSLLWARGDDAPARVRIERSQEEQAWLEIDRASFDGDGHLAWTDLGVQPGERYRYRLSWDESGVVRSTREVAVEVPLAAAFKLEGLRPNPAVGEIHVAFSLPTSGPAVIELVDLAGRRVLQQDVGSVGVGLHVVRIDGGHRLTPGVYWLRLQQGKNVARTRAAVTQ